MLLVATLFLASAYIVNMGVQEYMREFRRSQRMRRMHRRGLLEDWQRVLDESMREYGV